MAYANRLALDGDGADERDPSLPEQLLIGVECVEFGETLQVGEQMTELLVAMRSVRRSRLDVDGRSERDEVIGPSDHESSVSACCR